MALDRKQLIELAKASARASLNPSVAYSFNGEKMSSEALEKTFNQELNRLGGNPHDFDENKNLIYALMETGINEVLPAKVLQAYGQFAEIKQYGNSDLPVFKVRISEASKKRAKQFVTKVGLAGRYETFKLDGYKIEVKTSAIGGAARIEWEELLDGTYTMADFYNLVVEGMDEAIYKEIANALTAMIADINAKNKAAVAGFDEDEMDRLIQTADAYGHSTIYCTQEFASKMLPLSAGTTNWNAMSDAMKDRVWNTGYSANYKGHNVVVLPQSFEDATNATKVINPQYAWIIPNGSEKPVKIAFQGSAQVKSFENRDWSQEIQTYQKVGVATYLVNPGICVYQNTNLTVANADGATV